MKELYQPSSAAENNSVPISGKLYYTSPVTESTEVEPALFICQSGREVVKFTDQIKVNNLMERSATNDFTFDDISVN